MKVQVILGHGIYSETDITVKKKKKNKKRREGKKVNWEIINKGKGLIFHIKSNIYIYTQNNQKK